MIPSKGDEEKRSFRRYKLWPASIGGRSRQLRF